MDDICAVHLWSSKNLVSNRMLDKPSLGLAAPPELAPLGRVPEDFRVQSRVLRDGCPHLMRQDNVGFAYFVILCLSFWLQHFDLVHLHLELQTRESTPDQISCDIVLELAGGAS